MYSNGVSEVSGGADERVGGMVNGTSLASGSIAESGACGGGEAFGKEVRVFTGSNGILREGFHMLSSDTSTQCHTQTARLHP